MVQAKSDYGKTMSFQHKVNGFIKLIIKFLREEGELFHGNIGQVLAEAVLENLTLRALCKAAGVEYKPISAETLLLLATMAQVDGEKTLDRVVNKLLTDRALSNCDDANVLEVEDVMESLVKNTYNDLPMEVQAAINEAHMMLRMMRLL